MTTTAMSGKETVKDCDRRRALVNVGNYQIKGLLGKGNFARVVEAVHTVLQSKVLIV